MLPLPHKGGWHPPLLQNCQPQYKPLSVAQQVSILYAGNIGSLDDVENKDISSFKEQWFEYFSSNMSALDEKLNQGGALDDADKENLKTHLDNFKNNVFKKD